MKKLISILFTVLMLSAIFSSVSAFKPVDGDIVDMWGQLDSTSGDSLTATTDGVKITFGRPMWAIRVTTLDAFKLDGLTISFKGVSVADQDAIALGIFNTEGGWAQDKGIIFIQFTTSTTSGIGPAPNGYIMAKESTDMTDVKPRVINDTLLTKKPAGDFKVSFKKNADGSWIYEFNGQQFPITKEFIDNNIKNQDKVYFSFGNWGQTKGVISYTVTDIAASGSAQPTATKAPAATSAATSVSKPSSVPASTTSSAATSSEAVTSTNESNISTVSTDNSKNTSTSTSSSKSDDGSNTGTIIVVIIIIVALAGAGTAAFLLLKKKQA